MAGTSEQRLAEISDSFFRPAVRDLVPYEPGKPVEEVQRELGLGRVVKLASNEGPFGPFPAALEAIARTATDLNRYPDGGAYRLRAALAELHDLRFEEVAVGAGSDGLVDGLSQIALDPGDEIVSGWPSFPSYVITAHKLGAGAQTVPLSGDRYDLEAMLGAITPRTKLVYICHPNNPTGTMNTRAELDAYFDQVPDHVLTVLDQAYFEYIDDPDYPDGIAEYLKTGCRVVVLRTFSKIFGLAGVRVGYALASPAVVTALGKVRRAFDVTTPAQEAALASLDDAPEIERRRLDNASQRPELERILREHGLHPAGPAVANFLYCDLGEDSRPLFEQLLRQGVIVRPTHGFGGPTAIRVTVGTADENRFFAEALDRVRSLAAEAG
ncbi:MAG TPA: histidinol-phosphate transaminase [Gaiellaceae bacterium]|nr:histidinol-phosphate transaminase [Gaiellaceae bacterium]